MRLASGTAILLASIPVWAQGSVDWQRAHVFEARTRAAMAYDVARERTVLLDGGNQFGTLTGTWEWDGTAWIERAVVGPPGRHGRAMAYDSIRQRIVVFGGSEYPAYSADTWEWDGTTWTQRAPATSPQPRSSHAMAFDVARGRVVLFGGQTSTGSLDDTWEWDGANWSQANPVSRPAPRLGHTLAYDAARGRVVLFGGVSGGALGDTWEWDGVTWTPTSSGTAPPPRWFHASCWDAGRRVVLVTGGTNSTDTWEWDGVTWRLSAAPGLRRHATSMAYDVARRCTVLIGGHTNFDEDVCETWELAGGSWQLRASTAAPHARYQHALASDLGRSRIVLFGGRTFIRTFADTWEWDGFAWNECTPVLAPLPRAGHAMAYDSTRRRTVLFGGGDHTTNLTYGDTWEWDGVAWTAPPVAAGPSPRQGAAMAYDPQRRQMVLFGGTNAAETWTWDGSVWTLRAPAQSPPRWITGVMTYDAVRQRVVLFGGWMSRDTWEWDGANWSLTTPVTRPPVDFVGPGMTWDPDRQRAVLFGVVHSTSTAETWEWDGNDWAQRRTSRSPSLRDWHALAFDGVQRCVLMFGGMSTHTNTYRYADTWLLGALVPAASRAFGAGCAGTHGVPLLGNDEPYLGHPGLCLSLSSVGPLAPCAIGLATAPGNLALGGGCTLHVSGTIVPLLALANAAGVANARLPLPLDPSLRGATIHAQGFVADPRGPVLGVAFSGGRTLVIGD